MQVLGGLGQVVGHHPGMGGLPGPAHGHVGQLPSPAVGEQVGPGRGRTLTPVDRCGISQAEAVGPKFFTGEGELAAVVGAQDERTAVGLDCFYCGPLRGDQGAGRARGQCDDAVAGPVAGPARADELRTGQPAGGLHPRPSAAVELGHVGPAPGVQPCLITISGVSRPGVHRPLQGVVTTVQGVDTAVPGVPVDGLPDVPVAQGFQGLAFFGVVLATVLRQVVDGTRVAGHQGAERSAGADRAQLVVVAGQDQLGPAGLDVGR